jgi:hypothetical protein
MFDNPNPGPDAPLPPFGTLYDINRLEGPTLGGKLYWGYDRDLQEWTWRITQYGEHGEHWSERPGGEGGHYTPPK